MIKFLSLVILGEGVDSEDLTNQVTTEDKERVQKENFYDEYIMLLLKQFLTINRYFII